MNSFGGGEKTNHLIASGAAFVFAWSFLLVAIVTLVVAGGILLVAYTNENNANGDGGDSDHKDLHLNMGISCEVIAGILLLFVVIPLWFTNEKFIAQFTTTEMNPLIRTANEATRLNNRNAA